MSSAPQRFYRWREIMTPRVPRPTVNRIQAEEREIVRNLLARSARERAAAGLPPLPVAEIGGAL